MFSIRPELSELGRVAIESLERGESVPLITAIEMNFNGTNITPANLRSNSRMARVGCLKRSSAGARSSSTRVDGSSRRANRGYFDDVEEGKEHQHQRVGCDHRQTNRRDRGQIARHARSTW